MPCVTQAAQMFASLWQSPGAGPILSRREPGRIRAPRWQAGHRRRAWSSTCWFSCQICPLLRGVQRRGRDPTLGCPPPQSTEPGLGGGARPQDPPGRRPQGTDHLFLFPWSERLEARGEALLAVAQLVDPSLCSGLRLLQVRLPPAGCSGCETPSVASVRLTRPAQHSRVLCAQRAGICRCW